MGDDNYGAALLAMGLREDGAVSLCKSILGFDLFADDLYEYKHPTCVKRAKAIAYLRERKLYCLDRKQPRIPPQARPQTLLDKWMKERHK